MSSDYSPMSGPPIIHRDPIGALRRPPAPDDAVSPHFADASELMAQARVLSEDLEPFPGGWAVTFESGTWAARLDPAIPLTDVELELGYGRTIERTTRPDLLDAVRGRDEVRAGTWT